MTTDDADLGLLTADEDEADPQPPRRRRVFWAVLVALLVLIAGGAVALVGHGLAHSPDTPPEATTSHRATPTRTPSATDAPAHEGPVILQADLERAGRPIGRITVGTGSPVRGIAPTQVPNFGSCTQDTTTLEYLPVEIRSPLGGLAARLTVRRGPGTPADAGRIGFFFQSGSGELSPCKEGSSWPMADTFEAVNDPRVITGYVVLDQAVTAATPQGRPDVFPTLQLQISDVRQFDDDGPEPLTLATPGIGGLCPGTTRAACVPLG
jgi:hypothetical protein